MRIGRSEDMSLDGNATAKTVLRGKVNNPDKIHGKSAYEIALLNGFEGTETEWLASLKGDTGEIGPQGKQGIRGEKGDTYTLTAEDKTEIAEIVAETEINAIEQALDEIISLQASYIDEDLIGGGNG